MLADENSMLRDITDLHSGVGSLPLSRRAMVH